MRLLWNGVEYKRCNEHLSMSFFKLYRSVPKRRFECCVRKLKSKEAYSFNNIMIPL